MSILSDKDIIRELGRNVLFHPLKPGSIRACDLCLTASEYAYAIGIQQRLSIRTETKQENPNEEQKYFEIPPQDTVLVWTDESVYLSAKFRGPLYSRVELVSKGIGHIGTRVNPCWSGVLCIALHNVSAQPVRINVRDVNQPIAYLAIEKLSSKTSNNRNPDRPGRTDVLRGLSNTSEIIDFFIHQREHNWMSGDTELLKKLMLDSDEYKKLKRGIQDIFLLQLGSDEITRWTAVSAIAAILAAIIALIALFKSNSSSPGSTKTSMLPIAGREIVER